MSALRKLQRGPVTEEIVQVKELRAILSPPLEKNMPEKQAKKVRFLLDTISSLPLSPAAGAIIEKAIDNYNVMVGTVGFDNLFSGAAITGNGKLAMVIDMEKLLEHHA